MQHSFGPNLCNLSCQCGHTADIGLFTSTPVNGDLPTGHYQCPACNRAWTVMKGKIEIKSFAYEKYLVSLPNQIIRTEARL